VTRGECREVSVTKAALPESLSGDVGGDMGILDNSGLGILAVVLVRVEFPLEWMLPEELWDIWPAKTTSTTFPG